MCHSAPSTCANCHCLRALTATATADLTRVSVSLGRVGGRHRASRALGDAWRRDLAPWRVQHGRPRASHARRRRQGRGQAPRGGRRRHRKQQWRRRRRKLGHGGERAAAVCEGSAEVELPRHGRGEPLRHFNGLVGHLEGEWRRAHATQRDGRPLRRWRRRAAGQRRGALGESSLSALVQAGLRRGGEAHGGRRRRRPHAHRPARRR